MCFVFFLDNFVYMYKQLQEDQQHQECLRTATQVNNNDRAVVMEVCVGVCGGVGHIQISSTSSSPPEWASDLHENT